MTFIFCEVVMLNITRSKIVGGMMLGAGLVLSSLALAAPTSQPAGPCDACERVDVRVREVNSKGRPTGYTTRSEMKCDHGCKSALENFFATGKFQHTCGGVASPSCGMH
jgi:hypothetical protein